MHMVSESNSGNKRGIEMTHSEQIARAVQEACANKIDPTEECPCGCGGYDCDCGNVGNTTSAAKWAAAKENATAIRALPISDLVAALPKQEPVLWDAHENTGMRYFEESDITGGATDCIAIKRVLPKQEPVASRIARLESLLNHAVTELSRAALSEDFDSQDCMDCIKMIEDEFSAAGKTSDWQTLSNLYDRLCAACGVSNEDEIDIMPIVEARLRAALVAQPDAEEVTEAMVTAYLAAQEKSVKAADDGLHRINPRKHCADGLKAALLAKLGESRE